MVAHVAGLERLGNAYFVLLGVGAANTAVSAYYYLRIVRAMLLEEDATPSVTCGVCGSGTVLLTLLSVLIVAAGIIWNPITKEADRAAATFTSLKVRVKPSDIPDRTEPAKKLPPPVAPGKGANNKKDPAT